MKRKRRERRVKEVREEGVRSLKHLTQVVPGFCSNRLRKTSYHLPPSLLSILFSILIVLPIPSLFHLQGISSPFNQTTCQRLLPPVAFPNEAGRP